MGEEWNDGTQSKEQIEARQQNKQEAAMRRERALAYAFSHQVLGFPKTFFFFCKHLELYCYPNSVLNFNVFSACNAN